MVRFFDPARTIQHFGDWTSFQSQVCIDNPELHDATGVKALPWCRILDILGDSQDAWNRCANPGA
jgi:hypothetical protein